MSLIVVVGALFLAGVQNSAGQCGYELLSTITFPQPTGRILNAPEAPQCAWPWVVAIRENVYPFPKICSGVLVGKTKVITTASCIERFRPDAPPALVVLGEHDITIDFQSFLGVFNETYRLVKSIHIHPNYSGKANDIAVIRLSEDVTYTPCILPACLPTNTLSDTDYRVENTCAYAGWGITRERVFYRSAKLREAFGQFFSQDLCSLIFNVALGVENPENTACVEPAVEEQRACWGDEGGMVACEEGGQWILESLINQPSCAELTPTRGVDLRAPAILDFINNN